MTCRVSLAILTLLASIAPRAPGKPAAAGAPLIFVQVPFRGSAGDFLSSRPAGNGSRIVRLDAPGTPRNLTPEFVAAADPSVSFDGRRILFSAKRNPTDPWNVWEMSADGSGKRQVTRDLGNCREAAYLAPSSITPPDFEDKVPWAVFVSDAPGFEAEGTSEPVTSLYVASLEPVQKRGQVVWRTTFNLSSDWSPTVIRDGRVIYTSRSLAHDSSFRHELLVSNWDGSGLNLFCGDRQGAAFKTMTAERPDRELTFIESDAPSGRGGKLAQLSFRRPLKSYRRLSQDSGLYVYPRTLSDGSLAVSYSNGADSYAIRIFDPSTGRVGAVVFDDPAWEDIDVQPLVPRPEPQGRISAVVDSLSWGELHCMSVYESDLPGAELIHKGDVKRARFIAALPSPGGGNGLRPAPTHAVLGDVPVEPDGSFFVRLPADTPFRIEMLDRQGSVLRSMSRWIWVRRGTSRGCIGCHEERELTPENRASDAVRRGAPHSLMPP